MKKSILATVFFFCLLQAGLSQRVPQLTSKSQISVITFGPYQGELWSAFGHSGIRVYDPMLGINWMYDWGRFDFNQKNFYWNFARGKMLYSIGRTRDFDRYLQYYISEDRSVHEQVLNLTPAERQTFLDGLEQNYLPESKEYFYNYVNDNCATRIKDLTVRVVPDSIHFPYSYKEEGKTVRDLMDDYLSYQPWGDFVIDVALGTQIDQDAEASVYLFLPDYVEKAFAEAIIIKADTVVDLIAKTNFLYETKNEPEKKGWFTPFNFFVLLFFAVGLITNRDFKKKKRSVWLDNLLFSIVSIFGLWFAFLWFGTQHLSEYNWNLIWAFPLHIPLIFMTKNKRWQYPISRLYRFLAVLHGLTLVFWFAFPQPLHEALVPLLITLILRSIYVSYDLSRI